MSDLRKRDKERGNYYIYGRERSACSMRGEAVIKVDCPFCKEKMGLIHGQGFGRVKDYCWEHCEYGCPKCKDEVRAHVYFSWRRKK